VVLLPSLGWFELRTSAGRRSRCGAVRAATLAIASYDNVGRLNLGPQGVPVDDAGGNSTSVRTLGDCVHGPSRSAAVRR
jgi:hypothetical protein